MSVKEDILAILETNRGSYISGHKIAVNLGISRSMVWKTIKALQAEGYQISAGTNKGYRFEEDNDILSVASIRPFVHTQHFGKTIKVYKTLESTNDTAKQLAMQGEAHGTVVIAEEQTKGRGRLGRSFFSPSELGIYMSIIIRPQCASEEVLLITCGAAVAVAQAIEAVAQVETQIKWVNDVYIDGKKVSGILTEAAMDLESGQFNYIVLGIGVNVTTKSSDFPDEIKDIAESIARKSINKRISRSQLIGEILNNLEYVYEHLQQRTFLEAYKKRSYIIGEEIIYMKNGHQERAKALDIDRNGGLVVRDAAGNIKILNSGEISVRKLADINNEG